MVVHGGQDTLVPARTAERLVERLRSVSTRPVVHAELPGAQHTFDLLHSLRLELVVHALWSLCTWASAGARPEGDRAEGGPGNGLRIDAPRRRAE